MTRKPILALAILAPLAIGGCAQVSSAVSTVCTDMAALPPAAIATLDAQDPHSALGVLWADAKAGCANGVPAAGVSTDWIGMIVGELKVLIPQVLPALIPLVVGLL